MAPKRLSGPVEIGRRVVVWGTTGSGKTSFARRLGDMLGLGVVEMDAIRHARGWDSTPLEEFRLKLTEVLDGHRRGWVCDGSYSRISDVYLSRADTLVWLRAPWHTAFWRLLKRTLQRAWTKEPLYSEDGPIESWQHTFLSRKSILWWSITHHRTHVRNTRQRIAELPDSIGVYELRSAREVEAFLAAVEAAPRGPRDEPSMSF